MMRFSVDMVSLVHASSTMSRRCTLRHVEKSEPATRQLGGLDLRSLGERRWWYRGKEKLDFQGTYSIRARQSLYDDRPWNGRIPLCSVTAYGPGLATSERQLNLHSIVRLSASKGWQAEIEWLGEFVKWNS